MAEHKISGRELARQAGIPYKTLQEWIGPGGRMPHDPEAIRKIAKALRCSVHMLLYGEEDGFSLIGSLFEKTEIHTGLYEITVKRVKNRGQRE